MTGYLASLFERNYKIPAPSDLKGKNVYCVEPEPEVAVPILLKKLREARKLSREILLKCSEYPIKRISDSKSREKAIQQLRLLNALQRFSIKIFAWNLLSRKMEKGDGCQLKMTRQSKRDEK